MNIKRRTLMAWIGAGVAAGASGLVWYRGRKGHEIRSLAQLRERGGFDVCIVGSGPAGATLARDLVKRGKRVIVVESGAAYASAADDRIISALDVYSSTGAIDYPLAATRVRAVGGTSNIWTGRCPRLLPGDLADNPLAPEGDWPISYAELQSYYPRAEHTLHVVGGHLTATPAPRRKDLPGPARYDISELRKAIAPLGIRVDSPPTSNIDGNGPVRVARDLLPDISADENLALVTGATVTRIHTAANGRARGIEVRDLAGNTVVIEAANYVVAAGAVESARLLLLSRADRHPDGIGNRHGHVGRYFMEHPFHNWRADIPGIEPFSHWQIGRTYEFGKHFNSMGLGKVVFGFYGPRGMQRMRIVAGIEMSPDPTNRLELDSAHKDQFGNPGIRLNLAYSDRDTRLWGEATSMIQGFFRKLDSGPVEAVKAVHWSHHHFGTTRMSAHPENGVVDRNLRVWGADNLFVASSSVFPTAGASNPTLTIVALAHRLGDHLAGAGSMT